MNDYNQYYRNSTISVNCRSVPFRPDMLEIHSNIKHHLQLAVEEVIQIEFKAYQHAIFIQVTSDAIVELTLQKTGKEVAFRFQNQIFHLPILKVVEDITSVHVATLPHDFPNNSLSSYFAQFGTVIKIEQHKFTEKI